MRALGLFVAMTLMTCVVPAGAQDTGSKSSYLAWSAAEAERIGKSTRVDGRVGGAFDFRVVHTEHSFNYKLRATWLTEDAIHATARLLSERLRLPEGMLVTSFQSRVGRERWLHPYTDKVVRKLASEGVKRLDVACPGFSVDCLETLEEIAMQNRDFFIEAGGETLRYIPALNDSPDQVASLTALVLRHTQGWNEFAPDYDPAAAKQRVVDADRRAGVQRDRTD